MVLGKVELAVKRCYQTGKKLVEIAKIEQIHVRHFE